MSRMGEDGSLMLLNNQYLEIANGDFGVSRNVPSSHPRTLSIGLLNPYPHRPTMYYPPPPNSYSRSRRTIEDENVNDQRRRAGEERGREDRMLVRGVRSRDAGILEM